MSSKTELPPASKSESVHSARILGATALILWAIACGCIAAAVCYAYDRDRIRLFTLGLLMVDLSMAVLATLIWYLLRYYLRPQAENYAIREYLYRAGYRDATMKYLSANPDLHLVQPAATQVPAQPPRGRADGVNGNHRTRNYAG